MNMMAQDLDLVVKLGFAKLLTSTECVQTQTMDVD